MKDRKLVISCHADTGFEKHSLECLPDGIIYGELDNYIGVYVVMKAYFSGRLNKSYLRLELTYGEEKEFEGAYEVLKTLHKNDVVLVVDVTGTPTQKDCVFEKCKSENWQKFLSNCLSDMNYDLYEYCPDPVANQDETDVYIEKCKEVCFLGIPCFGGDYNLGKVYSKERFIEQSTECICRIVENFEKFPEV
jgi:hypothetical protein